MPRHIDVLDSSWSVTIDIHFTDGVAVLKLPNLSNFFIVCVLSSGSLFLDWNLTKR